MTAIVVGLLGKKGVHMSNCILCIDDDPMIHRMFPLVFQSNHTVTVKCAGSSEEAWNIFSNAHPEIIICDTDLGRDQPKGYELCTFLAAHYEQVGEYEVRPVFIGMSGDHAEKCEWERRDFLFVPKPLNVHMLNSLVETHLSYYQAGTLTA